MDTKRDDTHPVEVLLRQTLKLSDSRPQDECLDAETLAAWVEGGLRPDERRAAQSHMADCSRCQAIVASLVKTTPVTPAPAEVSWFRRWHLQWLVPLTASAAAIAIWFALPGDRRRSLTEQEQIRPAGAASTVSPPEQRSPSRDEQLTRRAADAEPNLALSDRGALAARTESPDGARTAEAARAKDQPERAEPSSGQGKGGVSEEKRTGAPLKKEPDGLTVPSPAPTPAATTADAVGGSAAQSSAAQSSAAAPSGALTGGAPPAAAPPLPAARKAAPAVLGAATPSATANATEPTGAPGRRDQTAAAATSAGGIVSGAMARDILSPDGNIRWRIVGPGAVQRSTDAGATWEPLQVDSTTDLTAGSAPTSLVCWFVGRAGVVLLSTDGRRFVRRPAPSPADLVAVQAGDARTAMVTDAGGRTYRTSDGGATWEPSR